MVNKLDKKSLKPLKVERLREKEDLKGREILRRAEIFRRIAKAVIYLLVFLLPLFFLPWTSNVSDFNKQALLLILVLISLICWLIGVLISNKLEINTGFLNIPIIVLLLVSGLSTIFSIFRYGSFWGWPQIVSSSFISLLGFVVFYFIIANLFKKNDVLFLLLTLLFSGFFTALFFIFQIFGKFIFPFDFAKNTSFNTVGTANSLAIYLSLLLLLLLPLLFFVSRFFKIFLGIIGLTFLFSLLLINFKTAWLISLTGAVVLFTFGMVNLKKVGRPRFVTLMMIFLVIVFLLTFFRFSLPGIPTTLLEVSPSQKATIGILKQLPLKSLILGSGPGTFIYDWSKYKSPEVNQTIFWAVRFEQGACEILDRIITTGILGILAFFFLLIFSLKLVFNLILKEAEGKESWFLTLGIIAGFTGLIVGFFLYPTNLTILFFFWLLIGSLALLEKEERKTWLFSTSSVKVLGFSFLSVLILLMGIGFSIIYIQKYFAEVKYLQGLKALWSGNNTLSSNLILRASILNPKMDIYLRDLSQIYLNGLNELLAKTDLSQEEKTSQAQSLIAGSVNSANQAVTVGPNNVANWNVLGFVYRNMVGILKEADDLAIKSYEKSAELEPTNPYIFTEIGRVYLIKSDIATQQKDASEREKNIKLALENLEKALKLKPDYVPAHFEIAMIYVREGNIKQAIEKLETAKQVAPLDTGLAFQLGLIYYNDNQLDKAKLEFERAIKLDLNYSNARYFLGLIYDEEGNKVGAINQFEKIEKLNPDNEEVKKILNNLRKGEPALEGLAPAQPPIEEKTPERLGK